jgi:hypothetical protein
MLHRPPSPARSDAAARRARQARYRRRQAAGRLFAGIEFTPGETAKLHRLGYLGDCQLEDREAIAAAIHMGAPEQVVAPSLARHPRCAGDAQGRRRAAQRTCPEMSNFPSRYIKRSLQLHLMFAGMFAGRERCGKAQT